MSRVEENKAKKFNKSYCLVEFEEYSAKLLALGPDSRLFGFCLKNHMITMDDADYKKSVLINNLYWGSDLSQIVKQINSIFYKAKRKDLIIV